LIGGIGISGLVAMLLVAHEPTPTLDSYTPRMQSLVLELDESLAQTEELIAEGRDPSQRHFDSVDEVYDTWGRVYTELLRMKPPEAVTGWHERIEQAARIANELRHPCRDGLTGEFELDALEVCEAGLPKVRARLADAPLLLPGAAPPSGFQ
ncbi:MAG TPA: hypothetical protein VIY86_05070, partial [Pirellulaceae bacterium]